VLRFLRAGGGAGGDVASLPPPPSPASVMPKSGGASEPGKDASGGGGGGHEAATISGRVRTPGGQPIGEAYVYVDGLRSSARGHTVEIKQRDKQFAPRVTVVPLGTKVVFPNQDTVIHNVFSTAPGNSFDLGSVKGGETSPPVVLLKPGPVEIFCNIHSKMRADVLVVPNNHWTRVAADGSFSLSGVPVGSRKLVLWSPTLKPVSQQVDVTAKGGTVSFSSDATAIRPHLNKRGQAYGSYDE
jgi:plastocyanin